MPQIPIGSIPERDRCYRSADLLTVSFTGVPLFNTNSETERTFIADQNYFLSGISLFASLQSQTSNGFIQAFIGWCTSAIDIENSNSGINGVQSVLAMINLGNYGNAGIPATIPAGVSNAGQFFNLYPFGFYLPQGKKLFLMASSLQAPTMRYSTVLYLMPMFS